MTTYYEVVEGDTLSGIAQRFYGDASKYMVIYEANRSQLSSPDRIRAGQTLAIPSSASKTYVVARGDTLSGIAKKFYGNANKYMTIYEANRSQLSSPDEIRVGQRLVIP